MIYVGDFLSEFGPDALRYFIAVAGPENQDTDFTWDEFVRRTNFELANEWGNLVNRSISMAHKNVGAIPRPARPPTPTPSCSRSRAAGVRHRRRAARRATGSSRRSARRCGWSAAANRTCRTRSRGSARTTRDRRDTILHTALQVVQDANTLLTPFLPHAAQQVHAALGRRRACGRRSREIGRGRRPRRDRPPAYPVLTGDYTGEQARWESTPIEVGRPLAKPTPLFTSSTRRWARPARSWAPIA